MLKRILPYFLAGSLIFGIIGVASATVLQGFQGGTGISTSTSGNNTKCLTQSSSTPFLTWTIGTCGGGGSPTSTINGFKGIIFDLIGDNIGITSTVVNGSTTFKLINPGFLTSSTGVTSFNGNFGTVNGVSSLNLIYGDLSLAVRASGTVPTIEGGGAPFYINFPAQGSQIYAPSTTIPTSLTPTTTLNGFTGTVFDIIAGSGLSRSVVNGSTTFYGVSTSTPQIWLGLQQFLGIASTSQLYVNSSTFTGLSIHTGNVTLNSGAVLQVGGTAVTDGGGNWISNIVQALSNSLISQNPTGTTSVGNFVQNGGVTLINTTTTLSGNQFCGGGLFYVKNTTASVTITLPTTSTISSSACGSSVWTGSFAQQYIVNNSTNTVYSAINGTGESQVYTPGTPYSLAPGQEWSVTGQFENSSLLQGATSTGTTFVAKYTLNQTSTPWVVSGTTVSSTIQSALWSSGADGVLTAYSGASACAGRGAVTTISALGATTCSTSVGISTSTANLWTALQEFSNVSTTQLYSASTTLTGINSSIIWSNATGKLGSYGGTGCGTGSAIATLNSSGTATCATITGLTVQSLPSSTSWLAGQLLFGLTGGTASSSALVSLATSTGILTIGSSTITNLNASIASTSLETVNQLRSNSSTLSGVTTAANVSSTNIDATNYMRIGGINVATSAVTSALLSAGAGGALSAFGGSGPCTAGQYTTQISALGVLSCASAVVSLGGQAGTITVDNTLSIGAGKILSVATSSLGSITLTSSTTTNVTFTNATGTNLTIGKMLDNSGNQYVTSSAQYPIQWTVGNEVGGQQDGIFIFSTTSTIRSCLAGNVGRTVGNSNVFNLGFTTSTANATSSWNKLFSTDQNIITNGTTTSITVNASTTWSTAARSDSIPYQLGYYSDTASSSEFTVTCFATTP